MNVQYECLCTNFRGNFLEKYMACFVNETSLGTVLSDLVLGVTGGGTKSCYKTCVPQLDQLCGTDSPS